MMQEELLQLLTQALPTDRFLTDSADLDHYGHDSCKRYSSNASLVVMPRSTEEVSALLKVCNAHRIAVVPSGGRTGLSGGGTALNGEVILSLAKMNRIISLSTEAQTVTCEAGLTTQALTDAAKEAGFFFGIDIASKGSSQIGGNIATNAGGSRVIRHGNTREWVLGLTAVLANGEILKLNGELVKNQTGYDFRHLFIGSEGTLAIITEAVLKLAARPPVSTLALCASSSPDNLLGVLSLLRKHGFVVGLIEYFDQLCHDLVTDLMKVRAPFSKPHRGFALVEVETPAAEEAARFETLLLDAAEAGLIDDVIVAQSSAQAKELFSLRESISECTGKHFFVHKHDISVPVRHIPEFLVEFQAAMSSVAHPSKAAIFGHIGDGNLHIHFLKPENVERDAFRANCDEYDRVTFEIISRLRGSVSAEHGVGLLKKDALTYTRSPVEIELMRALKKVFDPNSILNPGKIFDA